MPRTKKWCKRYHCYQQETGDWEHNIVNDHALNNGLNCLNGNFNSSFVFSFTCFQIFEVVFEMPLPRVSWIKEGIIKCAGYKRLPRLQKVKPHWLLESSIFSAIKAWLLPIFNITEVHLACNLIVLLPRMIKKLKPDKKPKFRVAKWHFNFPTTDPHVSVAFSFLTLSRRLGQEKV